MTVKLPDERRHRVPRQCRTRQQTGRVRLIRCTQNLALLGFLLVLITIALLARPGSAFAAGPGPAPASPRFAPGHILVAPQPGSASSDFQQVLTAQGGRSLGRLQGIDVHMVEVPTGSEQNAVSHLTRNPHVLFAELDQLAPPAANANDPYFGNEWHLAKINAPTAWDTSTGIGITIAILDSGIDGTHPDLAAQMVPGWNFFDNNSDTTDVYGHGTAVAGVAAAALNNSVGMAGVAGGARVMPVRIADATGHAYWSAAAQGLAWAADHGAQVANISFEGMTASSTMQAAAQYFRSKGGAVIVAAGNTGAVDNTAPTDTMIVVSATDNEDRITNWSTYGSFVDISAPGQNIYSTAMGGGYGTWSGTSMAAPIVAGTAALILALRPELTPEQVGYKLRTTATDLSPIGPRIYFGYGRVNAAAAVLAANALPTAKARSKVTTTTAQSTTCTHVNPTVVLTPSQSVGVQAGTMVPFNITVTNHDTTACGVSGFDLTHSIPAGWTAAFLSSVIWLSPGTSVSTALQVTSPAGTPNGSDPITATATNEKIAAGGRKSGNTFFLGSASATYVVANAVASLPIPVVVPGAPTIGTGTAGNAEATVSFAAPASNGGSVITSYTVVSSPGGISASGASSPITVTGLTNGTAYTFTVNATNAVGTGAASAASNSVTPAALSAPKLFGLHTIHMVTGTSPADLTPWPPLVPTTTVRFWDIGATWADVNTASGVYDWTLFDAALAKASANGADIIYTLAKTPGWASSNSGLSCSGWPDGACAPPTSISTWTTFITAAVKRAAGKIRYWECWNEPNNSWEWVGSISQLVSLCQAAYSTIKAIDPTLMIIAPATDDPNWLASYLAAGGGVYADVMSFHGYPRWGRDPVEAEQIVQAVPAFKAAAVAYGQQSKEIWDTESSWTNNSKLSDTNLQAAYVAKYYLLRNALGVARSYWYAHDANTTDWANFWLNPGIAPGGVGTITPAGKAAQQVQKWMNGANVVSPVQRQALANQVKNPTMAGAIPGTPGTMPTNWSATGNYAGLTKQIVGTGSENGIPYMDYRIFGTYSGSSDGSIMIFMDDCKTPASVGQFWTQTNTFKLVGGSTNNIWTMSTFMQVTDNNGLWVQSATAGGSAFMPLNAPLGVLKVSGWGRINGTAAAYICPALSVQYHPGALIDMTLRIGAPTLDRGTVWSGTFSRSNGYQAQVVWDQAGSSTYSSSTNYTRYRDLDGNTASITPGSPLTIGYKPIFLENFAPAD